MKRMNKQIKSAAVGAVSGFLVAAVGLCLKVALLYSIGTVTLATFAFILCWACADYRKHS